VDKGSTHIHWTSSGTEPPDRLADPAPATTVRSRLPVNDNKIPWKIRLKRRALLILTLCVAAWLAWTRLH